MVGNEVTNPFVAKGVMKMAGEHEPTLTTESVLRFLSNRRPIEMEEGDRSIGEAAWRRWKNLSPEEKQREEEILASITDELIGP